MLFKLFIFAATASAAALVARDPIHGDATFTQGSISGGTCSFANYSFPPGIYGAGLGPSNWANGSKCGACLNVQGPNGNSVTIMIVDSCPSCTNNRLNLYSDAYNAIAAPNSGIIPISYNPVSCNINSPLSVRNKIGTSQYYFSMQVLNANYPIIALDISTDGGNKWQSTVRQNYNYFEKNGSGGFGSDTVIVRISCSNGNTVILPDVSVSDEVVTVAPVNC